MKKYEVSLFFHVGGSNPKDAADMAPNVIRNLLDAQVVMVYEVLDTSTNKKYRVTGTEVIELCQCGKVHPK